MDPNHMMSPLPDAHARRCSLEERRETMEDLILAAEQAVSRAQAAVVRATWLRMAISDQWPGLAPIGRRDI
jgi:hypothetical protein